MIKISFELVNGYVQGWHLVTEQYPAMFVYTAEFNDIEDGQTADEQLRHFNDNYFAYTLKDNELFFDEKMVEPYQNKQENILKIEQLKKQLAAMDYKTSKHADGEYTETDWSNIVFERKSIRQQIRQLEKEQL